MKTSMRSLLDKLVQNEHGQKHTVYVENLNIVVVTGIARTMKRCIAARLLFNYYEATTNHLIALKLFSLSPCNLYSTP